MHYLTTPFTFCLGFFNSNTAGVCGFAGIASGEFINIGIPEISLGQSSPSVDTSNDGYYEWCYRMGYDC